MARVIQFPPMPEIPDILSGRSFTIVQAAYLGNEADGAELIRPLAELGPEMNTFAWWSPPALGHLAMDPEDPIPAGLVADDQRRDLAPIDALLEAAGPGSGSRLASVELRSLGGALDAGRGRGARATLERRLPDVRGRRRDDPDGYAEVLGQADGVSRRSRRGTPARATSTSRRSGRRAPVLRRGHAGGCSAPAHRVGPERLFLANHEIKDS